MAVVRLRVGAGNTLRSRLPLQDNVYILGLRLDCQAPVFTEMHSRTKTAQVNLRILPELKAAAEKAAADDHRSLTSLIEKLLTDHLKAKGYLTPEVAGNTTGGGWVVGNG